MSALTIKYHKKRNGEATITYTRADGSATGQGGAQDFYIYHDMGHYAVETTLGLRRAFLGLVAEGWNLADFGAPWPRGRFDPEDVPDLMQAEKVVGALDMLRYDPQAATVEYFNELITTKEETIPRGGPLTLEEWEAVRDVFAQLLDCWLTLAPGETMQVTWPR